MPAVYPITWEPPVKTGRYKHLQRRDTETWEKWLDKYAATVQAVAYDVALGGLLPVGQDLTDGDRQGWRYTTALKVDVLLLEGDHVWVCEVKPAASVSALGAAICYPLMLAREEPALTIAGGAVITENLTVDIGWLAGQLDVRVWTV